MESKIVKVRENIKASYTSKYGTLFVHGITLEINPTEYEYHSKENSCKKKVGEVVHYSLAADKQGNQKIKFEKAPEGGTVSTGVVVNPEMYRSREGGEAKSNTTIWLSVFNSLAIFTANKGTVNSKLLIEMTDSIVKTNVPR